MAGHGRVCGGAPEPVVFRHQRGQVVHLVVRWRDAWTAARHSQMQSVLEMGRIRGALKQLQVMLAGLMRGERGRALQAWRTGVRDEQRDTEMAQLKVSLCMRMESSMAQSEVRLRAAAGREIRAVMVQLAKGQLAMRIEVWRSQSSAAWRATTSTLMAAVQHADTELRVLQRQAAEKDVDLQAVS